MSGLYVPGKDGRMQYQETAEKEVRPILSYEEDTGRILLNFNQILGPKFRKLRDIIVIGENGQTQGLILTSMPMGPEERAALELAMQGKQEKKS